ncbi:hypothetical protein KY358_02650 [Candidatus Woesearchaeota archaeon]|nr:hypothetical protein [Candidatus Woesearchaeota archaeon]
MILWKELIILNIKQRIILNTKKKGSRRMPGRIIASISLCIIQNIRQNIVLERIILSIRQSIIPSIKRCLSIMHTNSI